MAASDLMRGSGTLLMAALAILSGVQSLKNVRVSVIPPEVLQEMSATVLCEYDLEGNMLLSVKFYRGVHEFYSYTAGDNPPTRVFPFPLEKSRSSVDLAMSNATQVRLRNVSYDLAGNLSCEVTADTTYDTQVQYTMLNVIVPPSGPPEILTSEPSYDPRDILTANCTSRDSKPEATLSFYVKDKPVFSSGETKHHRTPDGLMQSSLSLQLQLSEDHFEKDIVRLRCNSAVSTLQPQSTEKKLSRRTAHPRPARVMSANLSPSVEAAPVLVALLSPLPLLLLR